MGDQDRTHRHSNEEDEATRPHVKVTDRRRVRQDESPPDPAPAPAAETEDAATADVTSIEAARQEANEYRDHLLRLKAEFDNYRKRVLKEQTRAVDLAAEPLMRRLLEVVDDFELALMAAETRPDFDKFLHGVELVYAKLIDILRSEGLERIEAHGKPFDPARHEALMQSGGGEGDPVVADVLRQGYALKGHVIRPAGVRVARS
jgi:molecular chaperone GrpE